MLRILSFLLLSLAFACCQTVQPQNEDNALTDAAAPTVRYDASALQKLQWLAGVWKGEEAGHITRRFFQFHNDRTLEVMCAGENGEMTSCMFTWYNGSYYYGTGRRWIVTWIGEKDIRFDPVLPGTDPMTWTRLNDRQWHMVRHTASGDKAMLMERTDEMQP